MLFFLLSSIEMIHILLVFVRENDWLLVGLAVNGLVLTCLRLRNVVSVILRSIIIWACQTSL